VFGIINVNKSINENNNDHSLGTKSSFKQLLIVIHDFLVLSVISAKTSISYLDLELVNEFSNQVGVPVPTTNH